MPGCWKGMLGGGGEKVLLRVIPRPSIIAWQEAHTQRAAGSRENVLQNEGGLS